MPGNNLQDYAILAGVNQYSHRSLSELKGAVGDTVDFLEWLLSEQGGNVPEKNVFWFCTPDPHDEGLPDALQQLVAQTARRDAILDAMGNFIERAEDNDGEPIGRRLYVFFSGHGVAKSLNDRCFFASDHTKTNDRYLVGPSVAEVFIQSAIFKEVLLFMDCCQVYSNQLKDIPLDLNYKTDARAARRVEHFFSYAGEFGQTTREQEIEKGKFRGILSRSILDGLRGGAATSKNEITANGLKDFIERRFVQLRDPDSDDMPDIPSPKHDFVISTGVKPIVFTVDVEIVLTDPDSLFIVLDGGNKLKPVNTEPERINDNTVKITLEPGKKYLFGAPADNDEEDYEREVIKTIVVGGDNRVEL